MKISKIKCPRPDCTGTLESHEDGTYTCLSCARDFSEDEVEQFSSRRPEPTAKKERRNRSSSYWEQFRDGIISEFHSNGYKGIKAKYGVPLNAWYKIRDKWQEEGHLKLGNTHSRGIVPRSQIPPYPEWDEAWDNDVKVAWLQSWPQFGNPSDFKG